MESSARGPGAPDHGHAATPQRRAANRQRRAASRQGLVVGCLVAFVGFAWALATPAAGAPAAVGVSLFDDDGGTAMFTAADALAPGRPVAACLRVGADHAQAGDLVTFAANDISGALADHVTLTLETGTGGRFGDCSGFAGTMLWTGSLRALGATSTGDGVATGWQPDLDPVRSFRVTVEVDPGLETQGLTATGELSWRLLRDAVPTPVPTDTPTDPPSRTDEPGASPEPTSDPTTTATSTPTGPTTATGGTGTRTSAAAAPGRGSGRPDVTIASHGLRAILDVVRRVTQAAVAVIATPQYPLMAIGVALLFLTIQDFIDRRDPKLAAASVNRRESELTFPDVLVPGGGRS